MSVIGQLVVFVCIIPCMTGNITDDWARLADTSPLSSANESESLSV